MSTNGSLGLSNRLVTARHGMTEFTGTTVVEMGSRIRLSEPTVPPEDLPSTVIPAIGEPVIRQLVHAFYQRVQHDALVGGMYPPNEWEAAETRLADFLVYRLGGSQDYLTKRGAPRLRMRHASFAITPAARNRWMELMTEALAEVPLPQPYANIVTQFLSETATFLINRTHSH